MESQYTKEIETPRRGEGMKIKIITIHCLHNFGSVYQASALQRYLLDNGYDVEIIDYRPAYFSSGRNRFKTYVGRLLNYDAYVIRKKKFEKFISKYMVLTIEQYQEFDKLQSFENTADVFIAGGDQLWNDYHFSGQDPAYKLAFVTKGQKIAFGTSMGRDNYTEVEIKKIISAVHNFRFIGLREKTSVNFLKSGGLENVAHVVDPVLLLDKSFYENNAIKPKMERYALLYLVDKSPLLDAAVEYITRTLKLKIVHVCGFKKKCRCDYFLKDSGPGEILGLLMYAEFVISASFHATLFSILFNKNFVSLLPHENTNARITELLDYVGLKQRIISNEKNLKVISEPVKYDNANRVIEDISKNSRALLIETLKAIVRDREWD